MEAIRSETVEKIKGLNSARFELARRLHDVFHNRKHRKWGYDSFLGYVECELSVPMRQAMHLVSFWTWYMDFGEDVREQLKEVSWACLQLLMPVMRHCNVEEWIGKLNLSLSELRGEVEKHRIPEEDGLVVHELTQVDVSNIRKAIRILALPCQFKVEDAQSLMDLDCDDMFVLEDILGVKLEKVPHICLLEDEA